ncbi:hypothetical protein [uncultured Agrobacterium sp.]|uniref:hypothetical protein n=1 Tax=uncultured Agrobacterium sp. TaxID=157277 RepID=UPI0025E780AB|nr:hypothetical protein [uncultured Agrobacterium sp.]
MMTRIQETDPVHFPTQPNENNGEKRRAGKGIVLAVVGIGIMAFVIYMAAILIATVQS